MFKNMFKRSWLSIIRKPSRTVILVVILFVMANLMLATIAIKKSVNESVEYATEKLGGVVYLQADMDAAREQMESQRNSGSMSTSTPARFEMPEISEELVQGIAESEYIESWSYSVNASANAGDYTVVETTQNTREKEMQKAFEGQAENFNQQFGGGSRPSFEFNAGGVNFERGDTSVVGINDFSFVDGVDDGSIAIVDGQSFAGENEVVISSELADENDLGIGDSIKLKTVGDNEEEISLKVVGIYQAASEEFDYNTVYTGIETVKQLSDSVQVENVKFYLASASDKDAFLASIAEKYPGLADDGLKLDIDDEAYQTMVGPIENVGKFATTIMWIVIAASVVIITLIVVINVKDRRYEMGVLLSLGANRVTIIGQVLTELVIVGTCAFALSIVTGGIIAEKMGESLLENQLASEEQETEQDQRGGMGMMGGPGMRNQSNSDVERIEELDIKTGAEEYAILFGAGYVILMIAMVVPSVNILRYQPKTILSGKE